ncbi:KilA-N domain-containing protein [Lactonifactor sp. BIOML-A3]|uniref:KilA-N domain-containing protein n=1 Tax=Lactonifactor TaxID=420345 RepID=UPI0012B08600|nr:MULTISPECIES: KilA-N domain-containing protein [Lactonifactor]MCB5714247.1 KilA-N domain-containing protein [Lactonifactor longoviformis]MCB5718202.1 KilA-N domain-containing protein [Lactonifactor longoviformis]MSA03382.1 KilA-N domain-containing protein [Lactonifactor sp. BIOML-A5]MSA09731.1 KilA-N domain-containing protein [Lactonifactor sp. BIOML-A4]MSA14273.1 KilA-N domain-containing protein [Lactonifactor sp. BIOML-A3]
MVKVIKETIHANGINIGIYTQDFENEFISLTDIARYKSDDPTAVIQNWMRNRDVIEFLGLWERLHNPDFKPLEFEGFRKQAGANAFTMSPKKWIDATDAIGIVSKAGRYGGTYAHSDIAMSFATWISPEFQLYIMKDYRRLKTDENSRLSLSWNLNREISKLNYRIHTDAIKDNLIPPELTPAQVAYTYANEADMLNVVLFGKTAKQWKDENPTVKGNMRDMATLNQLLVLANLESYNAVLINQGKKQKERMELLRQLAVQQLQTLGAVGLNNLLKLEAETKKS